MGLTILSQYLEDAEETDNSNDGVILVELVPELKPDNYRGLVETFKIDEAEQEILDNVVKDQDEFIDGELGTDADDREELAEEERMKDMFSQLYGIDDETNEPFVKGSAYSLKNWDNSMSCIMNASSEHVIALEDYKSPGELRFERCLDRIEQRQRGLSNLLVKHEANIRAGVINKQFAIDYTRLTGHGLPGIATESFTVDLSRTNLSLALESVNTQQAALMAGGALMGVGLVYKLIQWFAKALNRNTVASNAIGANISAFRDRQERIKNGPQQHKLNVSVVNAEMEKLASLAEATKDDQALGQSIKKLRSVIQNRINSATTDEVTLEKSDFINWQKISWTAETSKHMNKFIRSFATGKVDKQFWEEFAKLIPLVIDRQTIVLSKINEFAKGGVNVNVNLDEVLNFKDILGSIDRLGLNKFIAGAGGETTLTLSADDWLKSAEVFNTIQSKLFEHDNTIKFDLDLDVLESSLMMVDAETFLLLDDSYVNGLINGSKDLEELSKSNYNVNNKGVPKNDKEDIERNKAVTDQIRVNTDKLVSAFRLCSTIIRFVISVRNAIGVISVAADKSVTANNVLAEYAGKLGSAIGNAGKKIKEAKDTFNRTSNQ